MWGVGRLFCIIIEIVSVCKKDTARRVIVEAFLCSLIAGSMRPLLTHFGLDIDLITPIGAALGLLGTSAIRQLILRFLKNKAGVTEDEN